MQPTDTISRVIVAIDTYLATLDSSLYTEKGTAHGIAEIRSAIARASGNPVKLQSPSTLGALTHMERALQATADHGQPMLADAIRSAIPNLRWVTYNAYDAEKIGRGFAEGHAFTSLIGEDAPVRAADFDLGIFLIAPRTLYRDHNHPAPELYAPLTGPHGWRFKPGAPFHWREAHHPVWNEPNEIHATQTGEEPFLCIFGWTKDVMLPARIIPSDDWAQIDSALLEGKAAA